jgi:hypothetical protein
MSPPPEVYVHLGLPKTGTTYLQRVLARNRKALARQGVVYPGRRVDHFFAAQDVLGRQFHGHPDARTHGAWDAAVAQARRATTSSIISHEILATARESAIDRVVSDLSPLPVRVIATVRDLPRQLLAVWQEDVKNGSSERLSDFLARARRTSARSDRLGRKFWKYQDAPGILALWAERIGLDHITIVTVPPAQHPPHVLWERFAEAVAVPAASIDATVPSRNASMGAAETEFVRRLNEWAWPNLEWPQYRHLVKKDLAETALAAQGSTPRLRLPPDVHAWAAGEGADMAAALSSAGYRVIGSLDDLSVSPVVESMPSDSWPPPDSEVLDAAVLAVQRLLEQLRDAGSLSAVAVRELSRLPKQIARQHGNEAEEG